MTADAFSDDLERSRRVGMNAHISKPIDLEKLLKTIADVKSGERS